MGGPAAAGVYLSEGRTEDVAYAGRPSVCRNCGALIGAGESVCMVCGAPAAAPRDEQQQRPTREPDELLRHADPETRRFIRAVVSRPAPFTFIFLTLCIFLFLMMKASGVDENPTGVLIAFGAKLNRLIDRGEWWRFVTPIFLHGGPGIGWVHLLVNMYGLFMLGPYVEKLYGSAKFTVFWVLTGIGGTVASYLTVRPDRGDGLLERFLFRPADVPSVGASGALFGLVGVLFVFGIKYRHELPEGFKRAFGTGMLPMIAINIFIGFTVPVIDNAAHLGGLASGAALALFIDYKRPGPRGPVAHAWHGAQFLSLALVVASFGAAARGFDAPLPNGAYIEAMNEAQESFQKGRAEGDKEAVDRAIAKLRAVPPLHPQADIFRDELRALLERESDLLAPPPEGTAETEEARAERARSLEQLTEEFKEWEARSDAWVRAEGHTVGLMLAEPAPSPAE